MAQSWRVAIAGCHRMLDRKPANHNFATAFDTVPGTEIVAVFDLGAETRQEFVDCWGESVTAYDNFGSMLQQEQPDILCLATSQKMHADQVRQAVSAGVRAILCDKPLVTSLTEADSLLDACRSADVPLAFGPGPPLACLLPPPRRTPARRHRRPAAVNHHLRHPQPDQPRLPLVRRCPPPRRRPRTPMGERIRRRPIRTNRPIRVVTSIRPAAVLSAWRVASTSISPPAAASGRPLTSSATRAALPYWTMAVTPGTGRTLTPRRNPWPSHNRSATSPPAPPSYRTWSTPSPAAAGPPATSKRPAAPPRSASPFTCRTRAKAPASTCPPPIASCVFLRSRGEMNRGVPPPASSARPVGRAHLLKDGDHVVNLPRAPVLMQLHREVALKHRLRVGAGEFAVRIALI